MLRTYQELEKIVSPTLVSFKADLTKHDRQTLEEYDGPFIYGYRPTGTTLIKICPQVNDYLTDNFFAHMREEQLEDQLEVCEKKMKEDIIWITGGLYNQFFLYYDGKNFHTCTAEKLTEIYFNHIEKLIRALKFANLEMPRIVTREHQPVQAA